MTIKSFSFVEEPSLRRSKADRRARELLTSTVRAHTGRHTHAELRRRAKAERYSREVDLSPEESESHTHQLVAHESQALVERLTDCDLERAPPRQCAKDGTCASTVTCSSARRKQLMGGKIRLNWPRKSRTRQAGSAESKSSESYVRVPFNPLSYLATMYKGCEAVRVGMLFDFYRYEFGPRYVWRSYFDEDESRSARRKLLQFSHQEPALMEGLLAVVQSHQDQATLGTVKISKAALVHRGRAIKLLQKLLNQPEHAYQDVSIYTIVTLLVADQNFCDWTSFDVNYRGLRSIIQARGGLDVIKATDPRMFVVMEYIDQIHQHYEAGLQAKNMDSSTLLPFRLPSPVHHALEPSELSRLPRGMIPLIKDLQIRPAFVSSVSQLTKWLHEHSTKDQSKQKPKTKHNSATNIPDRPTAIDDLFTALEWPDLTHAEFFIIIALLGITALHIPLFVTSSIASCVPKYVKHMEASLARPKYRHDYMLWASYAICGLPITMTFLPKPNWEAVDAKIRRDFFGRSWEDTRDVLASFHLDRMLEMRAEYIWGLLAGLLST